MSSATIRISDAARNTLRELAALEGTAMQTVLERALEHYRRQRLLEAANAAYAALRGKPESWREELEERAEWEATLSDGVKEP